MSPATLMLINILGLTALLGLQVYQVILNKREE